MPDDTSNVAVLRVIVEQQARELARVEADLKERIAAVSAVAKVFNDAQADALKALADQALRDKNDSTEFDRALRVAVITAIVSLAFLSIVGPIIQHWLGLR